MKTTLTAVLLSCALATALMAQATGIGPRSPQKRVQVLTSRLALTADQQSKATAIFTEAQTTESTLRASLRTAHQGLTDAVKSNNIVGMEQLSATVGNLTAQTILSESKARAAFYQILTTEQRSKLDQLESQRVGGYRQTAHRTPPASAQ